ncbi:MAG TPA: hypothetical protein VMU50_12950, partial [Polyangia bacterium]|nr:hypothetical protein [Polyangia bacterium]
RRAKLHEKSKTGNLGLGLYIASEIVAAHQGTLKARSIGDRTTLEIRLPRQLPGAVIAPKGRRSSRRKKK